MTTGSPPAPQPMRIGALAAAAGVSVQALRYYERRGLIAPLRRRASGYREYTPDTLEEIHFIRQAQRMGFGLAEIGQLLHLRHQVTRRGGRNADAVRGAIQAKRDDLARRMADLQAMAQTLDGLLATCDTFCQGTRPPAECPIFEAIDHADPPGSIAPAKTAPSGVRRARSAAAHPAPKGGP